MKNKSFILSIAFFTLFSAQAMAELINVPVYMALTGNDIKIDAHFTIMKLVNSQGHSTRFINCQGDTLYNFIGTGGGSSNSGIIPVNEDLSYPIPVGAHSYYLGSIEIDTGETYHLSFIQNYGTMKFSTWGIMGNNGYTSPGPVATDGLGIYFTTWEYPYTDYTVGEITFNWSSTYEYYYVNSNQPGTTSTGYFCPSTDVTGNISTLRLFIDFGLNNQYYQYVYYAAGDPGF